MSDGDVYEAAADQYPEAWASDPKRFRAAVDAALAVERERIATWIEAEAIHIDMDCPHAPDEHAEGTCELCDYCFSIQVAVTDLTERIARGGDDRG